MDKKVINYGSLGIGIIVLILVYCLYSQSWFSKWGFEKDINPFDVVTLIVSSIISVYIGIKIAKKLTQDRYEIDFLLNDLRDIELEVRNIEGLVERANTVTLIELLSISNKLRIRIEHFSNTLNLVDYEKVKCTALESHYSNLYSDLTNVDGDCLQLDEVNRAQYMKHCKDIILSTRSIFIQVNKN